MLGVAKALSRQKKPEPSRVEAGKKLIFPVYPQQRQFLEIQESFQGFTGGRGTGKSTMGALKSYMEAENGHVGMVVAPTYRMLADSTITEFLKVGKRLNRLIDYKKSDQIAYIRTKDGGIAQVNFRSGEDPNKVVGLNANFVWFDEASILKEASYVNAVACARVGKRKKWLTFTPKGKSHWTYDVFFQRSAGQIQTVKNTALVQASTRSNPFLSPEVYQDYLQSYGSTLARQEVEGEFVDIRGLMFARNWFDLCNIYELHINKHKLRFVRYWDKGYTESGDYTAGVLMAMDPENVVWYVIDCVYGKWSAFERDAKIKKACEKDLRTWGNVQTCIEVDPVAGKDSWLITRKALMGYRVKPVEVPKAGKYRMVQGIRLPGQSKIERCYSLQNWAEQGRVLLVDDSLWNDEWYNQIVGFPEYSNDDIVDATSGAFNELARTMTLETTQTVTPQMPTPQGKHYLPAVQKTNGSKHGVILQKVRRGRK